MVSVKKMELGNIQSEDGKGVNFGDMRRKYELSGKGQLCKDIWVECYRQEK